MSRTDGALIGVGIGLVVGALAAWLFKKYYAKEEVETLAQWGAAQPEAEIQAAAKDVTEFSGTEIGVSLAAGAGLGLGSSILVGLAVGGAKGAAVGLGVGLVVAAVVVAGVLVYDRYYNEIPRLKAMKAEKDARGTSTGARPGAGTETEDIVVPIVPYFPIVPELPETTVTGEVAPEGPAIIQGTPFISGSTAQASEGLHGIGDAMTGAVYS